MYVHACVRACVRACVLACVRSACVTDDATDVQHFVQYVTTSHIKKIGSQIDAHSCKMAAPLPRERIKFIDKGIYCCEANN